MTTECREVNMTMTQDNGINPKITLTGGDSPGYYSCLHFHC